MQIDAKFVTLVLAAALVLGIASSKLGQAVDGPGHQTYTLYGDNTGGVYQVNANDQMRHCKSPAAAHDLQGREHTVNCSDWQ